MALFKIKLVLFCVLLSVLGTLSSKLNVPRILLPIFSDFPTKFTLESIDGGCYQWTTTRTDIIQLIMLDTNHELRCSAKVSIETITKEEARNLAVVVAEDVNSGQLLKCDVIVDIIASLSIATTTREIFMGEVPEAFQVIAHDAQGNEFSSLEGIEFEWNIASIGPNKQSTILRYMPFEESPYETPKHIQALEEQAKKGYMALLEGVNTGTAKVSVRLPYPEYKNVPPVETLLTVIANLLVTPHEIYIMVGDYIHIKIFYMKDGKLEEIRIPDDAQYYLQSENSAIAELEPNTSDLTAVGEGKTRVVLHNRNIEETDPSVKLPSCLVHVVKPSYIVLNVLPYKNWAILIGDHHEIVAEVYSVTDHKLYLGPEVEVKMEIYESFHIASQSINGSYASGWGVRESTALVQACLTGVRNSVKGDYLLRHPLKTQGELFIYPRITITPSESLLPWDPQLKLKYEIDLVAKGGDNRFIWTSNNHSFATVTQNGHVRTLSGPGEFFITAAMFRNHHNRQVARVQLVPPQRLEIIEYIMEAEIGEPIYLHIAMYAEGTNLPFTQCQDLPFQIRQSDNRFRNNKTGFIPPIGNSCGNLAMIGLSVGTSKVTVSYHLEDVVLEDSVTITAYNPLKLLHPQRDIVLGVGSTINLVFIGGPRPLLTRLADHKRIVASEDKETVEATDVTVKHKPPTDENSIILVLCKKLGEMSVKLRIFNVPTLPNCRQHEAVLDVPIICGKPRKLHLQPEIKVADIDSCPMDLSADRVVVQSNQDIELDVSVIDDQGRRFLNITSFRFKWELRPETNGTFKSEHSTFPRNLTYGTTPISYKNYQVIKTYVKKGLIEVRAVLETYDTKVLKKNRVKAEWPEFLSGDERIGDLPIIETRIGLYLVEDTIVVPDRTKIFNHPANRRIVKVIHGSGYYELALSTEEVANVKYLENTREIEITPLRAGELIIQVIDLCLLSKPVFVTVTVVSVAYIEVEMSDKVELGRCLTCIVRLYDEFESLIDMNDVGFVDLTWQFTSNIASIEKFTPAKDTQLAYGEVHFSITGNELGDTKLIFTVYSGDSDVSNTPANLQVFPPLNLFPRNNTLIIGSTIQATTKGGPQPDSKIEFTIMDEAVADVSELGIIVAKTFGNTRINAKSVGIHPMTGDKIIYSEDEVELHVIPLAGIRLAAPITRFRINAQAPIWVWGIPEQITPMILGSVDFPPIKYEWHVQDDTVLSLTGLFNYVGILFYDEDRGIQRIRGLQQGKTKINVTVTVAGRIMNRKKEFVKLKAEIEIEIINKMKLLQPKSLLVGKPFLMAPGSKVVLVTNLDHNWKITYSIGAEVPSKELQIDRSLNSITNISNDIVALSSAGELHASGLGKTMLLITAVDRMGLYKTLAYVITVKPIHYMMLIVDAPWRIHLDHVLRVIPLGANFMLTAGYYDDTGNRFAVGPAKFSFRSVRYDLIRFEKQVTENVSVVIRTKRQGQTVFKGWAAKCTDYVKIRVEQVIKPVLTHLTSGDIICLWSPVIDVDLQNGVWNSSDESLVLIDSRLSVAFVTGNREGLVILKYSLQPSAPLHLQIMPVTKVLLHPGHDVLHPEHNKYTYMTNGPPDTVFTVPVTLHSRLSKPNKMSNLIQGWHCEKDLLKSINPTPFTCYVAFSNDSVAIDAHTIFKAESNFIHDTGQYACQLTTTGQNASEVSTVVSNLTLWATAEDSDVESEPLEVRFIPNVYVDTIVYLDEGSFYGHMNVTGLDYVLGQINVKPADSSIIHIDAGKMVESTVKQYTITLLDYHWRLANIEDAMGAIVVSPMTNQRIHVMIRVSAGFDANKCGGWGNSPIVAFLKTYRTAIVVMGSLLVVLYATFFVYSRHMQPIVNVNVRSNRSLLNAGIIPPSHPCAAAQIKQQLLTSIPSGHPCATTPKRLSSPRSSVCTSPTNCTCSPNTSREPVYGDAGSFMCTEIRRHRRFL